jgi:hypothetical protein
MLQDANSRTDITMLQDANSRTDITMLQDANSRTAITTPSPRHHHAALPSPRHHHAITTPHALRTHILRLYLSLSFFLYSSCFIYFSLQYLKFSFFLGSPSIPPTQVLFLGAFASSQKAPIALFVSVRPSLHMCQRGFDGRIFVIVDIIGFYENVSVNFKFG